MRVLLDTHALLWALEGSDALSITARETIVSLQNEVLVSSVSAWEIAIQRALGKLEAPRELAAAIDAAGFMRRLVGFEDCEKLQKLPAHHRDPFDRMLISQALVDGIPIVTHDPWISRYGVQIVW
jgi:PIN domain nuclease of toxin-antitoxin system